MADFELRAGEQLLESCRVTTRERKGTRAARLILTSERVVLCLGADMRTPFMFAMFGVFSGLIGSLLGRVVDSDRDVVDQQIARDDVAEVELEDNQLVVRSTGEGYGRTTIVVETKDASDLQQRLHRWAAGEGPAAPLPTVRVVRKD